MRTIVGMTLGLSLVAICVVGGGAIVGGQANMAHAHIGHVMDMWRDTPDQQGLLPTAIAEAEIAAQHAGLAARSAGNLDAMKAHAGHVLHAVDPTIEMQGPGLGYGVKKAAMGAAQHIDFAAGSDGASANVKTHATHVSTSANNTVTRVDEIVALAQQIQGASSAAAAAPLTERLSMLAGQLVSGADANGDGRIGWQEGEGGLQQANQHMGFMKKGEDLP